MELLFPLVPAFIALVFVSVLLTLVYRGVSGLAEWARNNGLPALQEPARVVAKRTEIWGMTSRHPNGRIQTRYFATFENGAGERVEFAVSGPQYGLLVEGDEGELRRQGTRYQGFRRNPAKATADRDF
jgi:hypothetical protein